VITNIWPNHLDCHGDFESYLQAKLNLFRFQGADDVAVVGGADQSLHRAVGEVTSRSGARVVTVSQPVEPYSLLVPGQHNQANAACAATVAGLLGVDPGEARARMAAFVGLPHRLEHIGRFDGVDYYNDSKATTPTGTATALASFDRPVFAIVGGQDRGDDLDPLVRAVIQRAEAVVCTGPLGPRIGQAVRTARGGLDKPAIEVAANLTEGVEWARRLAVPGSVILLSPGAPSYGEFVNYEHRGRAFVEAVRAHL
jgi:UDP-N-acetylmuramoylalanine--D-glutamate ligase